MVFCNHEKILILLAISNAYAREIIRQLSLRAWEEIYLSFIAADVY